MTRGEKLAEELKRTWRSLVDKTCPPMDEIPMLLRVKQEEANDIILYDREHRRLIFDENKLIVYAMRRLGRLQRADRSVEPDVPKVLQAIAESLPGLLACDAAWRFIRFGETVNNVVTLAGPGGYGKSTLAWYLATLLGGIMIPPGMDPSPVILWLREHDVWVPIIVFDDVAAWISKYWFMSRRRSEYMQELMRALELMRDVAGLVVLTARAFSGVAKRLRELTSFAGEMKLVVIRDIYQFIMITWHDVTEGERISRINYIDFFWPGLKVPDRVYKEMMEIRKRIMTEAIRAYQERSRVGR